MKFTSSTLSVSLLALAKMAIADSESFTLMSTTNVGSTGTLFLVDDDSGLVLTTGGSSPTETAVITDAGALEFSNGKYAVVDTDGSVSGGDSSAASTGFAIANGLLTYNGASDFYAVSAGGNYTLSAKDVDGSTSIKFSPRNKKTDDTADDFTPGKGTVKRSTRSFQTSSTTSGTATAAVNEQTGNAAATRAIAGAGAGVIAAIAGLLI